MLHQDASFLNGWNGSQMQKENCISVKLDFLPGWPQVQTETYTQIIFMQNGISGKTREANAAFNTRCITIQPLIYPINI